MKKYLVIFLVLAIGLNFAIGSEKKMVAIPQSDLSQLLITPNIEKAGVVTWEETFNTTTQPTNWQIIDNDGSGAAREFRQIVNCTSGGIVNPQVDSSFWFSNYTNANASGLIDEWLISPRLPMIASGDSLHLYAGAIGGSYDDSLRIWVSTTDSLPGSFTQIAYFKVDGPTGSWYKYSFDLSSFAGSEIFVAANYYIVDGGPVGTHSDNIWVDHFAVTGTPVPVTFTVIDSTFQYSKIMFKGTPTGWDTIPMYDDGTNGDPVAGDHEWTVVVDVLEGSHEWGAIEDDGSTWGIWLIQGPNPSFTLTGTTVTGQTSYTIPPVGGYLDVTFTLTDPLQQYVKIMYKGTATNWDTIPMWDDGTHGDITANDGTWTVIINCPEGSHEWGAIEDDGSQWGIWLIVGPNLTFTVTGTTVTGTTSYTLPVQASGDVTWEVDMSVMTEVGIYDQVNDSLRIYGSFNGWGPNAPAYLMNQDAFNPDVWNLTVSFVNQSVGEMYYKFYVDVADTSNLWNDGWERPASTGGGNRGVDFTGAASLIVPTVYYDDVDPDYVIVDNSNIQVNFRVDMTPAMNGTLQPIPFNPAEDLLYFISEEPTFMMTQGWADSDTMKVIQLTDPDGDNVYTGSLMVADPAFNTFIYRYAFKDVSENAWTAEPSGFSNFAYRVRYIGQDAARNFPIDPWTMPIDTWTNAEIKPDQDTDPYTALGIEDLTVELPKEFTLYQNYPNPFNPSTNFKFDLPEKSHVKLVIYNVLGQEVARVVDENLKAGEYAVSWNGLDNNGNLISSGMYFYKLETDNYTAVKKLVMLK